MFHGRPQISIRSLSQFDPITGLAEISFFIGSDHDQLSFSIGPKSLQQLVWLASFYLKNDLSAQPSILPDIRTEIETFAAQAGIAPATVTSRAVQNSRLYQRMKDGGSCTMHTAARIREYMATHPAPAHPETTSLETTQPDTAPDPAAEEAA